MEKYNNIKEEILILFRQLTKEEQSTLLDELARESFNEKEIQAKNLKNLMTERGISKGMYGNVEGFFNNEENTTKRSESAFKNKSMSDAIKALRAKRNNK